MKTQIFHEIKYDPKGQGRSYNANFMLKNYNFLKNIFLLKIYFTKTFYRKSFLTKICFLSKITKFWDFKKILPCTFIYEPILKNNYINTNINKTQRSFKVTFYNFVKRFCDFLPIMIKFLVIANIMKTQILHEINYKVWPYYNPDLRSYGQLLSLF